MKKKTAHTRKAEGAKLASFIVAASMSVVLGTAGLGAQAIGELMNTSRDW